MKIIKWSIASILVLSVISILAAYLIVQASLPMLSGSLNTTDIGKNATLSRDQLGTAVIVAESEYDAAYLLGYAHAQDRLFQMDLLRRQSAGELSALVGRVAINLDKKHRIHQFRKRAESILASLSLHQKKILDHYTKGVNAAAQSLSAKPFEYYLVGAKFTPWQPADSLLATYSMYIDLQLAQTEIDFRLTALKALFGSSMYNFFTLPSSYQAAIDNSTIHLLPVEIPTLENDISNNLLANNVSTIDFSHFDAIAEQPDLGSNNWGVSGRLTSSDSAMVSNDMHLGINVPAIWYRAQINYKTTARSLTVSDDGINELKITKVKVTGVSLPGTPAVIVGSNGKVAWGFTNSNVDNVDWFEVSQNTVIRTVEEIIDTLEGPEKFTFETTDIGPIREFNGKKYALKWVAHQDYAVNIQIADMAKMNSVEEGLALARKVRIPAQNMVIVDAQGSVAWQLTGAITSRTPQIRHALPAEEFSNAWKQADLDPAHVINPENGKVWSANARVISTSDLARFGDGGYALGARQQQIMSSLMQQDEFSEQDFYAIQLDNAALFLTPWHNLLLKTLSNSPQKYAQDIEILNGWQACACDNEVAYTLVRRFRSGVINTLLAPINQKLKEHDLSTSYLLRSIEPAIWALLQKQPDTWLSKEYKDYTDMLLSSYDKTKTRLMHRYGASEQDMSPLTWGNVNQLIVKHPFSGQLSFMSSWLDMPNAMGFGDSYMPAVQSGNFGASQRLIVRPGNEEQGILTIPGGQSGHFLSDFYRSGYDDYVTNKNTPLLPGEISHSLKFIALK